MPQKNSHVRKMRVQARQQALAERPVTTWQDDVAWLRQNQPRDGQPATPVIITLLKRHGAVTPDMGDSLLSWLATGNPDPNVHPVAVRGPIVRAQAARNLACAAWDAKRFAWCAWAINESPIPETTLRLVVVDCRGSFPSQEMTGALSPDDRQGWDGLWWRMGVACGEWGPGYGFFELGLNFTWPPQHMDQEALQVVVKRAQQGLDQLHAWQRFDHQKETMADMVRVFLDGHVVRHDATPQAGDATTEPQARRRAM